MRKKIWLIIITVVVVLGILLWVNLSCQEDKIKAAKKQHDTDVSKKQAEIKELEKIQKEKDEKIADLEEELKSKKIDLEESQKRTGELEKKIENKIPKRTKPFTKLAEAQKKYDELQLEYGKLWNLNIEQKRQLLIFAGIVKKIEKKYSLKEEQYQACIKINVNYRSIIKAKDELISVYEKARRPWFVWAIGGGITSKGFTFGLFGGLNLSKIIGIF